MKVYTLYDGTKVTQRAIVQAFRAGRARLICSWPDTSLPRRVSLRLDGVDMDTRGQCYMMSEEVWTVKPKSLWECFCASS